MANETTTVTAADLLFSQFVSAEILNEVRPLQIMRPFFRYEGNKPSNVYRWPIQADVSTGFTQANDPRQDKQAANKIEGTKMTNIALSTTNATATLGTIGVMATVTDELAHAAVIDPQAHFAGVLGRTVSERYEADASLLFSSFNGGTATSTVSGLIDAHAALLNRNVAGFGNVVAVKSVSKAQTLAKDATTASSATYWGNPNANINGVDVVKMAGYVGAPMGIPLYQGQLVPDALGGLFIVGQAIGMYEAWAPRSETWRDTSNVAVQLTVTQRYGVSVLRAAFGELLTS